jgi:hypothetical protein
LENVNNQRPKLEAKIHEICNARDIAQEPEVPYVSQFGIWGELIEDLTRVLP